MNKMKRLVFWHVFVAALLLAPNCMAQSLKDLFNKDNIEKAVNAVTGQNNADLQGKWAYSGYAIEFRSDNFLQKAGGWCRRSGREETERPAGKGWHQGRADVFHL